MCLLTAVGLFVDLCGCFKLYRGFYTRQVETTNHKAMKSRWHANLARAEETQNLYARAIFLPFVQNYKAIQYRIILVETFL